MAVRKYIMNMEKKEMFETICIFFCERLEKEKTHKEHLHICIEITVKKVSSLCQNTLSNTAETPKYIFI